MKQEHELQTTSSSLTASLELSTISRGIQELSCLWQEVEMIQKQRQDLEKQLHQHWSFLHFKEEKPISSDTKHVEDHTFIPSSL